MILLTELVMKTKRLLILFTFLVLATILVIYSLSSGLIRPKRDLPEIMIDSTLNVVAEYSLIDSQINGDSAVGLQNGLLQFIAHRSGLAIKLSYEKDLATAVRKLERNVYDVIAQNIPVTNENKKYLTFTVPVAQSKQALVQRKRDDSDSTLFITNQLDLANQTIYVTKGSPVVLRIRNLSEEIAEPIHIKEIPGYSSEQLIYGVAQKTINYAAVDKEIALKSASLFPDLDFSTDISFTQLQAWVIRKTSPVLLDSLNAWIAEYK